MTLKDMMKNENFFENLLITILLAALFLPGCTTTQQSSQKPTIQQTIQPTLTTLATTRPTSTPTLDSTPTLETSPTNTTSPTIATSPTITPSPSPATQPELTVSITAPTQVEPNKQYQVSIHIESKTQNSSSFVNEVILLDNSMEVFKKTYNNINYVHAPRWSLNIQMIFTIDTMLEARVKKTSGETATAFQTVTVNAPPLER